MSDEMSSLSCPSSSEASDELPLIESPASSDEKDIFPDTDRDEGATDRRPERLSRR